VLRKKFGQRRYEVTRGWKKLHNEEHCDLYTLLGIIRMIESSGMVWTGHVARMGEKGKSCQLLVESQSERDHTVRRRPVDNIETDRGGIGWGNVDWIGLA
jgi:hypothetical protein